MGTSSDLGDFLRTRRARLRPEDVGLVSYGARRVPGLRREELAQLAGISPTYYTRLEQGQSNNASDSVLEAVARALRLNEDERLHLRNLARPAARQRRSARRPEMARVGTRRLVSAITGAPVLALDRRNDVLAWNTLGHALMAGHLDIDAPSRPATGPTPRACCSWTLTPGSCTAAGRRRPGARSPRSASSPASTPTTAGWPSWSANCR
jgi:transcriptional regulator with XRE-family HTH domain